MENGVGIRVVFGDVFSKCSFDKGGGIGEAIGYFFDFGDGGG